MAHGAVGQHSLREQNLAAVLGAIYRSSEPVSRAGVAERTGLTRATVSTLVAVLQRAGLVADLPPPDVRRIGRPGVPLTPRRRSITALGLEVAADYYGGRVIDLTGETVTEHIVPGDLRGSDPAGALAAVGELARVLVDAVDADGMRLAGACLAVPGLVRTATGRLEVAPNLGWRRIDPAALLGLGALPVRVQNEAKLAGLAQVPLKPAPRGADGQAGSALPASFVYISGGAGIGSAIIVDGTLYQGMHGFSGEVGHVTVDPDGPACRCGNRGCLEVCASEPAILAACDMAPGSSIADVRAAWSLGSDAARAGLRRVGDALGSALADYLNLVDLDVVVLGGTYAELFDALEPRVVERLARGVLAAPYAPASVIRAPQRDRAALTGGARTILRDVVADPARWIGEPDGR